MRRAVFARSPHRRKSVSVVPYARVMTTETVPADDVCPACRRPLGRPRKERRPPKSRAAAWRWGWRGHELPEGESQPELLAAHRAGHARRERALALGLRVPGDGRGLWTDADREAVDKLPRGDG
jgi:hypothetical protein